MARLVINDELWNRLELLLPKPKGRHGNNDRLFIEGLCWAIRTGCPWRDMPETYGNWKTIYNRYNRWVKNGSFDEILSILKKRWRPQMAHD